MFPNFYKFLGHPLFMTNKTNRQTKHFNFHKIPALVEFPAPRQHSKVKSRLPGQSFWANPWGLPRGMHPAGTDWDIKANVSWGSIWDHHTVAKIKGNRRSSCLADRPTPTSSAAELINNRAQPGNYLILGQVKINHTQYKIG